MKIAKLTLILAMAVVGVSVAETGDPRVENVQARQIPDTKDVEVNYDLIAPDGGLFNVSATFQAPGVAPEPRTVTGDFGQNVAPGRNRRFVWDAGVDWPDNVNSNFVCTVSVEEQSDGDHGGVQLWEGGPYWAECNVGASKPEEYGLYFWWGDTVGHAGDWNFTFAKCPTYGKNSTQLKTMGYIDSTGNLTPAHDAATAYLGAPWRMPTEAEFSALISHCDSRRTSRSVGVSGWVNGLLVTGRGAYAKKSIFFPAPGGGYGSSFSYLCSFGGYWSSTPYSGSSNFAWFLSFYSGNSFGRLGHDRYFGQSVRPVRGFAK